MYFHDIPSSYRRVWLSLKFGNSYRVMPGDAFTELLLGMGSMGEFLSWVQAVFGFGVEFLQSFWPAEVEGRESPMSLCVLCFWTQPEISRVSKEPGAGFSSLSFLTGHQHLPGKNSLFCRHCQSQCLDNLGRSQKLGWQLRMGPVEWGIGSVHTKPFMELGLDFLMDSKGFNSFTPSCPSLAALLVCSPGSSSVTPSSSFFLHPPKLQRHKIAEALGVFVSYPVLLASAP